MRRLFLLLSLCLGACGPVDRSQSPITHEAFNPLVESGRWSQLHQAVDDQNQGDFDRLMAKNLQVNVISASPQEHRITPLHLAVGHGNLQMVQALHAKGASLSKTMSTGETPLHLAVKGDHLPILIWLIENGAEAGSESFYTLNPLEMAQQMGRDEMIPLLQQKGK